MGAGAEVLHGTYSSESQSDSPSSSSSCDPSVTLTSSSDSLKVCSVTDVPLKERSVTEVTLTVMSPPPVELTEKRETSLKFDKSQNYMLQDVCSSNSVNESCQSRVETSSDVINRCKIRLRTILTL